MCTEVVEVTKMCNAQVVIHMWSYEVILLLTLVGCRSILSEQIFFLLVQCSYLYERVQNVRQTSRSHFF